MSIIFEEAARESGIESMGIQMMMVVWWTAPKVRGRDIVKVVEAMRVLTTGKHY